MLGVVCLCSLITIHTNICTADLFYIYFCPDLLVFCIWQAAKVDIFLGAILDFDGAILDVDGAILVVDGTSRRRAAAVVDISSLLSALLLGTSRHRIIRDSRMILHALLKAAALIIPWHKQ